MLELIRLLQDGRFHSGEELGAAVGVSRSAIWKKLQQLESVYGLELHRVRGRGYRLSTELFPLDANHHFKGEVSSWNVFTYESLDSTNAEALRQLNLGRYAPFAITAEMQSSGRGRRGRRWVSPYGQNIYFSLALRVDQGARQLDGLSLVVGLAVVRALESQGVVGAGLKWPNDVLVSGKKVAGILLELAGDLADVCHVIIGVGINVNMCRAIEAIDQDWTSVSNQVGRNVDRNILLGLLQQHLDIYLAKFSASGFVGLRAEWDACHLWRGRTVTLTSGDRVVTGLALGVNQVGALCLQVGAEVREFSGGELSLRLSDDS